MSFLIRHFRDTSWTPRLSEDTMQTPDNSGSSTTYIQSSVEDLEDWIDNDANKDVLVERQHVPGREEQAIKFAEYMNTFKSQKKFKTKRVFYEYLQLNITSEKDYEEVQDDKTGFSDSSCKRLRIEGDCYILLQKNGCNDFPQSQSAALALYSGTNDDNILDVWKDALSKCGGNKKRVYKADISAAKKRFDDGNPNAEVQLEEANRKLEEKQKEIENVKKEAKKAIDDTAKKLLDLAKKETVADLQQKQELLDEFCLAYEDREFTKPIYSMEHLLKMELPQETPEERPDGPVNAPKVFLKCFRDGVTNPTAYQFANPDIVMCDSMQEWKESFFEYGVYFAAKKDMMEGKGKGKGRGKN